MEGLKEVNLHTEVESGDYLLHIEQEDSHKVYKLETNTDFLDATLSVVKDALLDIPKTIITFTKYDSPLRQRQIKKITIEK